MTTLQQIIESVKVSKKSDVKRKKFALRYLGKFKGIIPSDKTSSEFLNELRSNLYGKIKRT